MRILAEEEVKFLSGGQDCGQISAMMYDIYQWGLANCPGDINCGYAGHIFQQLLWEWNTYCQ